jgi:hypothetical protein
MAMVVERGYDARRSCVVALLLYDCLALPIVVGVEERERGVSFSLSIACRRCGGVKG